MNSITRFLPLMIALVVTAFCCTKQPAENRLEAPLTKSVSFEEYAAKGYNDPLYDNGFAEVGLGISIMNLKNNTTSVVWDFKNGTVQC